MNDDGIIDVFDLTRLREHIRKANPLPQNLTPFADLTGDGFLNEDDSVALINVIVGRDPAKSLPLASIREPSPFAGESSVALTREVILRFTMPLALDATLTTWDFNTQTPGNFYAEGGGRKFLTRVELSGDRLKATLFFLEPVPASARVTVTFDGGGINDLLSRAIDPEGDGNTGGVFTFTYDTAPITAVIGTGIFGHVYASEKGPDGNDVPLPGVLVRVVGSETLLTHTAPDGSFNLNPCPAGRFFVEVDGRQSPASDFPSGDYYPYVGKAWEALPGKLDNLAAGTGKIYLPLVHGAAFQSVSPVQETIITVAALPGVQLLVPANDLFSDDGTRGGSMTMAAVAPDRLPEPLPPGLKFPEVITIQTDGATNFDRPVPVRFPNLPDPVTGIKLLPRAKSALWSFNHDKGTWEIAGPMTVTDDGNFVVTDVGVGVRQPGWHGSMPGSGMGGDPRPEDDDDCWDDSPTAEQLIDEARSCIASLSKKLKKLNACLDLLGGISIDLIHLEEDVGNFQDRIQKAREAAARGDKAAAAHYYCLAKDTFNTVSQAYDTAKNGIDCARGLITLSKPLIACIKSALDALSGLCGSNIPPECISQRLFCFTLEGLRVAFDFIQEGFELAEAELGKFSLSDWKNVVDSMKPFVNAPDFAGLACSNLSPPQGAAPSIAEDTMPPNWDELGSLKDKAALVSRTLSPGAKTVRTTLNSFMSGGLEAHVKIADLFSDYSQQRGLSRRIEGVYFYRISSEDDIFEVRGRLTSEGALSLALPARDGFRIDLYHPVLKRAWSAHILTTQDGGRASFGPVPRHFTDPSGDADGDSLSDFVESIIGTSASLRDSDADGISDAAEIAQGTNPLDNLPMQTGVVASLDTPGQAKDIAAQNTVALLADGSEGVSVFDVANALNPVHTAQVRLDGSTESVALDGTLAAAAGAKLALLDLADLSLPRLIGQLDLGAAPRAVAAAGAVVYAGLANGYVVAVDMPTGTEIMRANVTGGAAVEDLSFAGDVLYVRSASQVFAVQVKPDGLAVTGSVSVNSSSGGGRLRIVAGAGLAYASHGRGWTVLSLADPLRPAATQTVNTSQFGWRGIVPTGSGLGVGVVSVNPSGKANIDLYNLGTNGAGSQFLTTFVTPGQAQAASIYNGLAYVADGTAGLTVVNYIAYDNKGIPPTISLTTSFTKNGGGQLQAEEGKLGSATAIVSDDVQVRNVEFYLDGKLVATDGGFPFEHRYISPLISPTKTSFTLRARAFDTGGNSTWSDELTIGLVVDATRPGVARYLPFGNGVSIDRLIAFFTEPIASGTLTPETFILTEAGPDSLFGSADDRPITDGTISYRADLQAAVITLPANLPNGSYRAEVSTGVTDLAGNAMAADFSWHFRVRPVSAQLGPVLWGWQKFDIRDFDQPFTKIAAGPFHTVALRNDGTVVAWGDNSSGQANVPAGLSGVTAIAAGYETVALKSDGTVVQWGYFGQTNVPAGLSGVSSIAAGYGGHTVALKNDGTVVAWGSNGYGQTNVPAGLSGVTAIAAASNHIVVLKSDGTVVAWGENSFGQTNVPAGLSGVTAVATGEIHTVALKNDGTVVAWGHNYYGQTNVPAGLSGVTAITAASYHSMALKSDGTVVAWGNNGQTNVPAGLTGVSDIAVGSGHAVALKNDGTVVAWGANHSGQTNVPAGLRGVAVVAAVFNYTVALKNDGTIVAWGGNGPVLPTELSGVSAIAAGGYYTMALKNDGTVVAWSYIPSDQTDVPAGLSEVVAIAAGRAYGHSVALKSDGTVVAWGNNSAGQTNVPAGLSAVTAIAAGGNHTVALKSDGTLAAWGHNAYGQTNIPPGLNGLVAIAAGDRHTIALKSNGTVVAWGGFTFTTPPPGLSGVVAISASGDNNVALKNDGTVVAWGDNSGGLTNIPAGLSGVIAIAAGTDHTLALKSDGTVVAWGSFEYDKTKVPVGLSGVTAIAAGDRHSAALVPLPPALSGASASP